MAGKKKTRVEKRGKAEGKKTTKGLSVENILALGGDKSDLQLIGDIKDSEDEMEGFEKDMDAEPIKHSEIQEFIKQLELHKYRDQSVIPDDEEEEEMNSPEESDRKDGINSQVSEEQPTPAQHLETKTNKKKKKNKFKVQDNEISSTCDVPVQDWRGSAANFDWKAHVATYKPRKYLLLKGGQRWYDEDEAEVGDTAADAVMQQMEQFASKLLEDEVSLYTKQRENNKRSDSKWLKTVLSSGTLSDKMAALTLLVGESPLHNLSSLESLITLAKKKGKREAMSAIDTLKDLFLSDLLPSERKLKHFHQHSLSSLARVASGNRDKLDKILIIWVFEDQLKKKYSNFIKAVDTLSYDTLLAPKQKAVGVMYQLLAQKPEEEKTLLSMLTNKLGDPDHKIAAKTSHLLTKLVSEHPNMNGVVVSAVEVILYRPNISKRAQYYAMCFLNQIVLDAEDEEVAVQLIKIYFSFFKGFVQKSEVDSKMMSALLTGVNRAYHYAKGDKSYLSDELNELYKLVHLVNFNTSIQALMLLHHVTDSKDMVSDRFYMALYRKLVDPALKNSSKQAMFLNLVFKTLRTDTSENRVKAFIKRLLQVCAFHSPHFICGVLFMLSEVIKKKRDIINFAQSYEDYEDDEEEHFVDAPEDPGENPVEPAEADKFKEDAKAAECKKKSSWVHRKNKHEKSLGSYDPFHRNPQFCGADYACVWELEKLAHHFHPSVSLFAKTILQQSSIDYTSDPLQDFTLIKFLDRFVYKNPKKMEKASKSVMSAKTSTPRNMMTVTSEVFLEKEETSVREEDKYLHKYFRQKSIRDQEKGKDDSDAESVSDSEFDVYLDTFESAADQGDFTGEADMDFAGEFGKGKKKQKKGKKAAAVEDEIEEDEDDDMSDDLELDEDDELAQEFRAELEDALEGVNEPGFDEEDIEFSDEDEFGEIPGKRKQSSDLDDKKKKKKFKRETESLFAAAEEFSHLLDKDTGTSLEMLGGTQAMSNTDNASQKQLKWEMERERKMRGETWKSKRGQKKGFKGQKTFKKKGNVKHKGNVKQHGGQKKKRKH